MHERLASGEDSRKVQAGRSDGGLPDPAPPADCLADDIVELRLLRVVGPGDEQVRPANTRFLSGVLECRFAIHRRSDDVRVGRIHIRITNDRDVVRALGHCGYEVAESHRRRGYATRSLVLVRGVARHYRIAPLWVLIEPENIGSRRTAERAGLRLVDIVETAPEGVALGLGPAVCRYAAEEP